MTPHPATAACLDHACAPAFSTWTDAQLLEAVRAGHHRAFGELYRRYLPEATRFARSRVRAEDVDDVVAESFAKILAALQRGKGPDDEPIRYLMVTLRSTALTLHAQRIRRRELARRYAPGQRTHDVHPGAHDDLLLHAFASLTPRWRQVMWWSVIEGLTSHEIGQRLGLNPGAAAALTYRARRGLRLAYLAAEELAAADGAVIADDAAPRPAPVPAG
jgi:RNA polymerase sigma factor (sigma-70 family)